VNGSPHVLAALLVGIGALVPIVQHTGWVSDLLWMHWREKSQYRLGFELLLLITWIFIDMQLEMCTRMLSKCLASVSLYSGGQMLSWSHCSV